MEVEIMPLSVQHGVFYHSNVYKHIKKKKNVEEEDDEDEKKKKTTKMNTTSAALFHDILLST